MRVYGRALVLTCACVCVRALLMCAVVPGHHREGLCPAGVSRALSLSLTHTHTHAHAHTHTHTHTHTPVHGPFLLPDRHSSTCTCTHTHAHTPVLIPHLPFICKTSCVCVCVCVCVCSQAHPQDRVQPVPHLHAQLHRWTPGHRSVSVQPPASPSGLRSTHTLCHID